MPSQVCEQGPGYLQVFGVFRDNGVSVDVVATSEISVSLTLDPRHALAAFHGWRHICQIILGRATPHAAR